MNWSYMINSQPTSNSMGINYKHFLKIRKKRGYPHSSFLVNITMKDLVIAIRQEQEIKGIQVGKREVKLSLFVNGMILYIVNPKIPPKYYYN